MDYVFSDDLLKSMRRYEIINTIIERRFPNACRYLEVGVADPSQCFNKIKAAYKVSVDPNIEVKDANVTFKGTSDEFFSQNKEQFDVCFLDGLHLAHQVWKDIQNSMECLSENGMIVLHDTNPPNWMRAHSDHEDYLANPREWNGSVWKALYQARTYFHCAIITVDSDEGCSIISKNKSALPIEDVNPFFDYGIMKNDRQYHLGLVSVDDFKNKFEELL